jgi:hypothetical protein
VKDACGVHVWMQRSKSCAAVVSTAASFAPRSCRGECQWVGRALREGGAAAAAAAAAAAEDGFVSPLDICVTVAKAGSKEQQGEPRLRFHVRGSASKALRQAPMAARARCQSRRSHGQKQQQQQQAELPRIECKAIELSGALSDTAVLTRGADSSARSPAACRWQRNRSSGHSPDAIRDDTSSFIK